MYALLWYPAVLTDTKTATDNVTSCNNQPVICKNRLSRMVPKMSLLCLTTTTVVLFAATNTNFGMPATNRVEWQHPESQHLVALRSIPD